LRRSISDDGAAHSFIGISNRASNFALMRPAYSRLTPEHASQPTTCQGVGPRRSGPAAGFSFRALASAAAGFCFPYTPRHLSWPQIHTRADQEKRGVRAPALPSSGGTMGPLQEGLQPEKGAVWHPCRPPRRTRPTVRCSRRAGVSGLAGCRFAGADLDSALPSGAVNGGRSYH
jgi:hypothetical protein